MKSLTILKDSSTKELNRKLNFQFDQDDDDHDDNILCNIKSNSQALEDRNERLITSDNIFGLSKSNSSSLKGNDNQMKKHVDLKFDMNFEEKKRIFEERACKNKENKEGKEKLLGGVREERSKVGYKESLSDENNKLKKEIEEKDRYISELMMRINIITKEREKEKEKGKYFNNRYIEENIKKNINSINIINNKENKDYLRIVNEKTFTIMSISSKFHLIELANKSKTAIKTTSRKNSFSSIQNPHVITNNNQVSKGKTKKINEKDDEDDYKNGNYNKGITPTKNKTPYIFNINNNTSNMNKTLTEVKQVGKLNLSKYNQVDLKKENMTTKHKSNSSFSFNDKEKEKYIKTNNESSLLSLTHKENIVGIENYADFLHLHMLTSKGLINTINHINLEKGNGKGSYKKGSLNNTYFK